MSKTKYSILVVDDEPLLQPLFLQTFEESILNKEYEFKFAENGVQALKVINNNPEIGIVFTDINMPEMDGLTLLAALSKLPRLFCTVVISAYDDMRNIRTAMNRGASDFITKPIDLDDLEITLKKTVAQYINLQQSLANKNRVIELQTELNIASGIQKAYLPNNFTHFSDNAPLNSDKISLYGEMLPAKEIGGDFFDFFPLAENKIGFVIADVSGKSISAALFMAISMSLIRDVAQTANSPSDCMKSVNRLLNYNNDSCMFVTVFYAIIDYTTGEMEFCNAGHNPPFIVSKVGAIKRMEHAGVALGATEDWLNEKSLYVNGKQLLVNGDTLVLYTDGVTEAMNSSSEFYGEEQFQDCLMKIASLPVIEFVKQIQSDVQNFCKDAPRADDVTLFAIRYVAS